MVYLIGIIGLIAGFLAGLLLLNFFLRHKTKEELLNDEYLKWKYGIICWLVAAFGSYTAVRLYNEYLFFSQ